MKVESGLLTVAPSSPTRPVCLCSSEWPENSMLLAVHFLDPQMDKADNREASQIYHTGGCCTHWVRLQGHLLPSEQVSPS